MELLTIRIRLCESLVNPVLAQCTLVMNSCTIHGVRVVDTKEDGPQMRMPRLRGGKRPAIRITDVALLAYLEEKVLHVYGQELGICSDPNYKQGEISSYPVGAAFSLEES